MVQQGVRAQEHAVGVLPAELLVQVLLRHELGEADDGVERRPQLVRHHREEARLRLRVVLGHFGGLVGSPRLADEHSDHHGAEQDDQYQDDRGHYRYGVRKLVLRHAEQAVYHLALGHVCHEHLLQMRLVYARHDLVQNRHELLRHAGPCEQLELLIQVFCAEILCGGLRHGDREHRRRAVRGGGRLCGIGDPEVRVASEELCLCGRDVCLRREFYREAGPRADLVQEVAH